MIKASEVNKSIYIYIYICIFAQNQDEFEDEFNFLMIGRLFTEERNSLLLFYEKLFKHRQIK